MGLKIGSTAYYFPNMKTLNQFISLNEGKIKYIDILLNIRSRHNNACFIFEKPVDGKSDWHAHTINYAKECLHAEVITFGYQRTE